MVCVHAKLLQSCPTLCNPRDCSLPGSSVHGILQARILELVAMPSSKGSSLCRDQTGSLAISCIGSQFLYHYCLQGSPPHGGIANECWVMCHQYSQIRGPHPSIKYENQNLMREFFYMLFGDCFFYTSLGSIERYSS